MSAHTSQVAQSATSLMRSDIVNWTVRVFRNAMTSNGVSRPSNTTGADNVAVR
jgi:hypothetical protein